MEQRRRRNQQVESPPEVESQQQPELQEDRKWRKKSLPDGGFMKIKDGFNHG